MVGVASPAGRERRGPARCRTAIAAGAVLADRHRTGRLPVVDDQRVVVAPERGERRSSPRLITHSISLRPGELGRRTWRPARTAPPTARSSPSRCRRPCRTRRSCSCPCRPVGSGPPVVPPQETPSTVMKSPAPTRNRDRRTLRHRHRHLAGGITAQRSPGRRGPRAEREEARPERPPARPAGRAASASYLQVYSYPPPDRMHSSALEAFVRSRAGPSCDREEATTLPGRVQRRTGAQREPAPCGAGSLRWRFGSPLLI